MICIWSEQFDGNYETGCGFSFIFNDGHPKENGFRFCPYCGNALEEKRYKANGGDEDEGN
jgi:hypothetical protein